MAKNNIARATAQYLFAVAYLAKQFAVLLAGSSVTIGSAHICRTHADQTTSHVSAANVVKCCIVVVVSRGGVTSRATSSAVRSVSIMLPISRFCHHLLAHQFADEIISV